MQNLILLPLATLDALEDAPSLGGSAGPDLTRYFVVCTLLILLTALVAWGLRSLVAGNLKFKASQRSLHVVDVLPLGGRRKLAVVRCYDRSFLLGLGEKEVRSIAELDVEAVLPSTAEQAVPETKTIHPVRSLDDFEEALRHTREKAPEASPPTAPRPTAPRRPVLDDGRGILG